jgi:hypothetical protein
MERIRTQVGADSVRVTQHADEEMVAETISLNEVYEALLAGDILENYPEHRRGACCLVCGFTESGRPLHVVCTTGRPILIVITVYEPQPPKWVTPTQRGGRDDAVQY